MLTKKTGANPQARAVLLNHLMKVHKSCSCYLYSTLPEYLVCLLEQCAGCMSVLAHVLYKKITCPNILYFSSDPASSSSSLSDSDSSESDSSSDYESSSDEEEEEEEKKVHVAAMDTEDEDKVVVPSSTSSSSSSPSSSSEEEEEAEIKAPSTPVAPVEEESEVALLEAEEAVTTVPAAQENLQQLSPKGIKGYHFKIFIVKES